MRGNFNLDGSCGNHLKFRDLIECSTTFKTSKISNIPRSDDSYAALEALAINILDPTIDKFKNINLTYGFASLELMRKIKKISLHNSINMRRTRLITRGNLFAPG